MTTRVLSVIDFIIYWSIVIMPFSVAIAPGPANVFIGLFSAAFIIKKIIKKEKLFINTAVLLPFLFMLIIAIISFRNSVSFSASFQGITKLLKYLIIFIVCSEEIKDKKHITKILVSVGCGLALASIDSLWQLAFGYDFIRHNTLQSSVINLIRPTAAFPNPNVFGIYMAALTPLIIGPALFYFKGRKKILMLLISALSVASIYLTLSRGAGLGVYLAILLLAVVRKNKLLIIILLAVLLIFPFVMPKNIKQWAKEVKYNPFVFMLNQDRISIYNNTINMIKHHPFIGVGVNTFSRNYGKYKLESAEEYTHTPDTIYAHNIFLHMAGEIGLLGLLSFVWFLFQVFLQATRAYLKIEDVYLKIIAISAIACLIAFLVNGLTETSLYYSRVAMVFWYIVGLSLSLNKLVY
jgi:O-antigen ligase